MYMCMHCISRILKCGGLLASMSLNSSTKYEKGQIKEYRRIPKVTVPVSFAISSPKGP